MSPNLKVNGPVSLAFSGPLHASLQSGLDQPNSVWQPAGSAVFAQGQNMITRESGPATPKFGTPLMRPHSMTHDNPFLLGDEAR